MLIWISTLLLAVSHLSFLLPFFKAIRRGRMPAAVEFAGLSAVVYFDSGLWLEALGFRYKSLFFAPFLEARETEVILAVSLMAVAPWLVRAGAKLGKPRAEGVEFESRLRQGGRRLVFYVVAMAACVGGVAVTLSLIVLVPQLWESRHLLGERLGPFIILLSVPMYLLAFYLRQADSGTFAGRVMVGVLLTSSIVSTLAVGERTLVLLPILMCLLFAQKVSWRRWTTSAALAAMGAALLLPLFKPNYQSGVAAPSDLIAETISNDFDRAPELARTLEMSSLFGTRALPYPGSGYVYAALYFVPRSIVPFKGNATAQFYTGLIMQRAPQPLNWGFGISAISEALLNMGIVFAPVVLLVYGAVIGFIEGKCTRWSSLQIPLCLACLWIFGYQLSALLLNFGAMALVGVSCERWFCVRSGNSGARKIPEPGDRQSL